MKSALGERAPRLGVAMLTAASVLVLAGIPTLGWSQSTSPGKNTAYVTQYFGSLPVECSSLVSATIAKGKSRTVLEISATMTVEGAFDEDRVGFCTPMVNGIIGANGGDQGANCTLGSPWCSYTAQWWIDLDQAELDNPGQVKGKPLVVELSGGAGFPPNDGGHVTLSVRMQKK